MLPRLRSWFKILGLLLIIAGVLFWLRSDFWQIKKVSCQINGSHCSEEIWAELMNLTGGKNFFLLSSRRVIQTLKKNHPEFFQIELRKQAPDGLLFHVEVRKPVVALAAPEGFYWVDNEGIILGKGDDSRSLPVVLLEKELNQEEGMKVDNELILAMIQILYEAQLRLLRPESTELVSERTIRLQLRDNLQVLFSAKGDLQKQLDSLQFIFERSKIEGDSLREVDLRFDKPVIVK